MTLERRITQGLRSRKAVPILFAHRQVGTWLAVPLSRYGNREIIVQILGCHTSPACLRRSGTAPVMPGRLLQTCITAAYLENLTEAEDVDGLFGITLKKVLNKHQYDAGFTLPEPLPMPGWMGSPAVAVLSVMSAKPYLTDDGDFRKPELMTSTMIDENTKIKQYTMNGMTWEGYQRYYRYAFGAWQLIARNRSSNVRG